MTIRCSVKANSKYEQKCSIKANNIPVCVVCSAASVILKIGNSGFNSEPVMDNKHKVLRGRQGWLHIYICIYTVPSSLKIMQTSSLHLLYLLLKVNDQAEDMS